MHSDLPPVFGASAMSALGVAVAQFAPAADSAANLAEIRDLSARAAERGARVVLFPEYAGFFVNPFDETLRENAEELNGPFATGLREIAGAYGIVVVAGFAERAGDAERVRNTIIAVDATGILAVYRKLHLYDAFGERESDWVEPGTIEDPSTFTVDGTRFALMTCYDLRFPEVARVLTDTDAHVLLVPAEWVRGPLKEHHWQTLLMARAIENTIYVAGADHPPPLCVGHSIVVDPQGVTVASVGTRTDVAVAFVDSETVENVRRINPALRLRRFRVAPRTD